MGQFAIVGAIIAFVASMAGFISAAMRKKILAAIAFATAVGGFILFLGG